MEPRDYKFYRPAIFDIDLEIGPNAGDEEVGTVSLNDRPFVIEEIHHQIISDGNFPLLPIQDGLYRIDWSIGERVRFQTGPLPMADAAFGSIRHGIWVPLRSPVELIGTAKINVKVRNEFGPRAAAFKVQVQFHGVEKVGSENKFGIDPAAR